MAEVSEKASPPAESATATEYTYDRINLAGVLLCCRASLRHALYPHGSVKAAEEGQIFQCDYAPNQSNHRLVFRAGSWHWAG